MRDEGETDPRAADSDGDGLGDGTEVLRLGTDPLNTDTDGDGLSDGRELGLDGDADPASRTDPLAVDATRQNAQVNGVSDRVEAHAGTLPDTPAETYPLVVANLVAASIIELAPRLVAHTAGTGTLIASGIIASRQAEVVDALAAAGMIVWERTLDDDWVTLRLVHAP